jgi:hypothetical protein
MSARQPRHPVECQGHVDVREAVWDSVSGNHQGQQPSALRKQAGHTTASDRRSYQLKKCLAMQEPSTQDIAKVLILSAICIVYDTKTHMWTNSRG